jgi:hypothetical protein
MKILIISIAVLCNILFLFCIWVIPFQYVKRTKKFLLGVLISWGLGVFVAFCISVFVPASLSAILPECKGIIHKSFPEEIVVVPILLGGWFQGLIVCSIAGMFHIHKKTEVSAKSKKVET